MQKKLIMEEEIDYAELNRQNFGGGSSAAQVSI